MNSDNKNVLNKRRRPLLLLLVLFLALTGCAQQQERRKELVDSRNMLIADHPTYSPGEFFEYDNGLSMIVTDSQNGMVTWKYANNAASSGYANFLVPQLTWEGADSRGSSKTNASQDFLWPLNIGGFGRFDITQTMPTEIYYLPPKLKALVNDGSSGITWDATNQTFHYRYPKPYPMNVPFIRILTLGVIQGSSYQEVGAMITPDSVRHNSPIYKRAGKLPPVD